MSTPAIRRLKSSSCSWTRSAALACLVQFEGVGKEEALEVLGVLAAVLGRVEVPGAHARLLVAALQAFLLGDLGGLGARVALGDRHRDRRARRPAAAACCGGSGGRRGRRSPPRPRTTAPRPTATAKAMTAASGPASACSASGRTGGGSAAATSTCAPLPPRFALAAPALTLERPRPPHSSSRSSIAA